MSNESDSGNQLQWSGERFMPQMRGNIRLEHLHRYFIAREMAIGKRVLDIACGEGYGSSLLAEVAGHVIGVDIAPEVVAHASGRYQRGNLEFRVGSCAEMPLADGSVDLVVCFETIEHLDDHEAMMREVKRVLAPGGSLVISSPDKREYSDVPSYQNPFHVRELYRDEFERLLRSHFRDVVIVGQRIWAGSVAWMLDQSTGSNLGFTADDSGAPSKGPLAPLYLIAVASDAKASAVPLSVLDGGGFVWPEDYVRALRTIEQERHDHVGTIAEVNRQHEASVTSLTADLDGHRLRLAELAEVQRQAGSQLDSMRHELDDRDAHVSVLEEARTGLARRVADVGASLEQALADRRTAEAELVAQHARVTELLQLQATHDTRVALLKAELDAYASRIRDLAAAHATTESEASALRNELNRLHGQIADFERANAELEQTVRRITVPLEETRQQLRLAATRLSAFEHARQAWVGTELYLRATIREAEHERRTIEAHVAVLEHAHRQLVNQLSLMEHSISWRLTTPLRAARSLVRGTTRAARTGVAGAVRTAYAVLPLSIEGRLKAKSAVFGLAPGLFRHTTTYRAWEEHRRTQRRLESHQPPQAAQAAPVVEVPAVWLHTDWEGDHVPIADAPCATPRVKALAFYLPQFHPIPENDQWWGRGFTEWDNVARGRPQFAGHYQPHLPGELGFYDLRLVEIQRRQIELARLYGLHGFCYHHYWFGGRRLLRRPIDQVLANPGLDLPFCLCWANENWTRRWDGHEDEVLIAQRHSPDDDMAFIRDIEPALRDSRYIRVGGRPLLVVYRPAQLPDARATALRWREHCARVGLGNPFLVSTQAFDQRNPADFGFDAAMEFAPNNLGSPPVNATVTTLLEGFRGVVYDYRYLVERSRQYTRPADYDLFRCVAPMWDNEPRRPDHGKVFVNSTPARYAEWLENACRYTDAHLDADKQFVFINAWNEWAEGAHLEPDRRYGYAYLQATADVLARAPARVGPAHVTVATHG